FTSEYGISIMLRPELPGLGDRIVDFPEGKVDECVFPLLWSGGQVRPKMGCRRV
nr:hypothetical protein [Tanacetum cinerariifolium]